jgi:hypothetical protein
MAVRSRFGGTPAELAAIISPHVLSATWLPYDDDYKTARVQGSLIARNRPMWEDLYKSDESLSYTQTLATSAFKIIIDEKTFDMNDEAKADWVKTVATRFRAQSRHLAQASLKKGSVPAWAREFSWNTSPVSDSLAAAAVRVDAAPGHDGKSGTTCTVQFDSEFGLPYRVIGWQTERLGNSQPSL